MHICYNNINTTTVWSYTVTHILPVHNKTLIKHNKAARDNSRGEGWIVLSSQVVRVQVEHANHEGHKHHDEDDHELEDIFNCAPQRDLQWAKAFIGWKNVGDAWETQHHSDGVQAFWDDLGVWWSPLIPGWRRRKKQVAE